MASFDQKWIHAQLNLAWRVVVHYARALWPWSPRFGLARFVSNYVPEGLPWATERSRELGHEPGRCTLCGACDDACPLLLKLSAHEFLGPMTMVSSAARAAQHFADARQTFETLTEPTCVECRRCEKACPEDIPILALATNALEQLAVVEQVSLQVGTTGQKPKLLPSPPLPQKTLEKS